MCRAADWYPFSLLHARQWRNNILASCLRLRMTPCSIAAPGSSPLPVHRACNMQWLEPAPEPDLSMLSAETAYFIKLMACMRYGHKWASLGQGPRGDVLLSHCAYLHDRACEHANTSAFAESRWPRCQRLCTYGPKICPWICATHKPSTFACPAGCY